MKKTSYVTLYQKADKKTSYSVLRGFQITLLLVVVTAYLVSTHTRCTFSLSDTDYAVTCSDEKKKSPQKGEKLDHCFLTQERNKNLREGERGGGGGTEVCINAWSAWQGCALSLI